MMDRRRKCGHQTIKEGLESTPGVTATRGTAWIVEKAKLHG